MVIDEMHVGGRHFLCYLGCKHRPGYPQYSQREILEKPCSVPIPIVYQVPKVTAIIFHTRVYHLL